MTPADVRPVARVGAALRMPAFSSVRKMLPTFGVAFVVIHPILQPTITSCRINRYGLAPVHGIDNRTALFTQARLNTALTNTVGLVGARQAISIVVGVAIARLIARSNLPMRGWLEVSFRIALFMPLMPVALSWVFMAAGRTGLLNQLLMNLPFVNRPVFNLYSCGGILRVRLMTDTLAVKIFLLVPAFRAPDPAPEEAARSSGATLPGALARRGAHPVADHPRGAASRAHQVDAGLFRENEDFEPEPVRGLAMRPTNLIAGAIDCDLPLDNRRSPGERRVEPEFGGSRFSCWIGQHETGRCSEAHKHESNAVPICLKGTGHTHTWHDRLGPTPWAAGRGDEVLRQDHAFGGMISAAPMSGGRFPQHFGVRREPLRLTAWFGGNTHHARRAGKLDEKLSDCGTIDLKEGGSAIPCCDEDPNIRQEFEAAPAAGGWPSG